jgi:RES domain-containing protein
MIVFRLCKQEYIEDFSGTGARRFGGRWNSKGIPMVYTGETRALCSTEVAVHSPFGVIPDNYFMVSINLTNHSSVKRISLDTLPPDWNFYPHQEFTQQMGDRFIREAKHLVLQVPSATIQGEHNFLINPHHPEIKNISIISAEPFSFDKRLFIR